MDDDDDDEARFRRNDRTGGHPTTGAAAAALLGLEALVPLDRRAKAGAAVDPSDGLEEEEEEK